MDYRDKLALFGSVCPEHEFDEKKMEITFEHEDDEGETTVYTLRAAFQVCFACDGHGKYVNPDIDRHGISQFEFDEDPEFQENYFSGRFDVVCKLCEGKRVFPEAVMEEDDEASRIWQEMIEEEERYQTQCAWERRMGC